MTSIFMPILLIANLSMVGRACAEDLAPLANVVDVAESPLPQSTKPDKVETTLNTESKSLVVDNADTLIKSDQNNAALNKGSLKNPYALLVSLAFKGKSAQGVRDYTEAAAVYCRAARDGDANAQYAMGWLYANGRGVAKDDNIAVMFYSKAAKQNHTSAREAVVASNGNPNLAELPKCMLPDPPPPAIAVITPQIVTPEVESTPFYAKGPIFKLVNKIAPNYKIETDLAMAFIAVESGFNPQATSPKNAQGLMQLIPETATRFKVKDAYNPEDNIKGGLAYLQWLLAYFKGDVSLVAAAYNSGEMTVEKYKGVPPYPETQNYVKKITSLYKKNYHPYREDMGISATMFNLTGTQNKLNAYKTNP
jgi:soluble lytic murein transglycosylase-like protein